MSERVLLLVPATSYRAPAFVRAAERMGMALEIGTDMPGAFASLGLPTHALDLTDAARSVEVLAGRRFLGVVATDERTAWLAAQLHEAGISREPHHTSAGVAAARDKRRMRAELARAGVAVPVWQLLAPGRAADELSVRFPCVVKPPMLSASQGVIRADDGAALDHAVARARAILERHPSELRRLDGFFELLVEDYVDGREVAVEAIVRHGEMMVLALFDKPEPMRGPFFEETLYVAPSTMPEPLQRRIVETAANAARALGLCHGPIHAELRIDGERPLLIEIAARSIGGLCSRALVRRCGSLEERLLSLAAGLAQPPVPLAPPAIGVMMIPVPRSGVLQRATGMAHARALPGIDGVEIAVQPGEAVRALPEGSSYLGFIFAHGDSPEEVESALRRAHAELRFDLKPLLRVVGTPPPR
jgi:biotin carboxylase